MSRDELIERMARRLCKHACLGWSDEPDGNGDYFRDAAKAALAVHESYLAECGLVVVPRDATPDMIHAATLTFVRENKGIEHAPATTWRAMIAASIAASQRKGE